MRAVKRGAFVVVAGLCLVAVGCGSSKTDGAAHSTSSTTASTTTKPSGHMTAQEIATKLIPLGCNATPASPSTINVGDIKPVTSLECTISGESVSIDEYVNAQQVAYNARLAKGIGCQFAKQFGMTEIVYVVGTNWTVTPSTAPTAEAIKKAIGAGTIVTLHC
jgi:hypothetical protein